MSDDRVPDSIRKTILLKAPLDRVWRAVSEAERFGHWFGAAFDGPFAEGARRTGRIVPTAVDAEVAAAQKPHEGLRFEFQVVRIEPMRRISFRWQPYTVDDGDCSKEPTTLIEFVLEQTGEGVRLTITESGFDGIPLARRAEAFRSNEGGWEAQARLVEKYLALTAD